MALLFATIELKKKMSWYNKMVFNKLKLIAFKQYAENFLVFIYKL